MSTSATLQSVVRRWDEANGVWVGDRAPSSGRTGDSLLLEEGQPLYIFGYGSLIWRSGDLLSSCKSYQCLCRGGKGGWKRRFAQRSMDHRGRPAFPGLVFNLVPAGDLSFTEDFEEGVVGSDEDGFVGVVYHVPLEDARHIIDELDFRERGGYERCTAEVELLEDTAVNKTGEKVNTTVYIGLASNPNFIHYGSSEGFFRKASIISAAYGPSGRNYEYLFRVVEYFRRNRLRDRYLLGLENAVRCRLGISRGHNEYLIDYYQSSTDVSSILLSEESSQELSASGIIDPNTDNTGRVLCRVFGLGSNEWGQLIRSSSCLSTKNIDDIYFTSTPSMCAVMDPSGSDSTPEARIRKLLGCHVLAGGSHSGLLTSGELHLWGSNSRGQLGPMKIPPSVCSDSDVTRGGGIVLSAALGHEHTLVLLVDGTVVSFGDDEYGQCSGTAADIPRPVSLPFLKHVKNWEGADDEYFWASIMLSSGSTVVDATIRVVHIAAGARHSVAITADGCIHCWGAGRHHQLMLASQPGWHPMLASGAEGNIQSLRFVDATAGMSHTLALDSLGRIWSWGHANRHGQLGRLPIASHTTPLLGDGLISTEGIEDERLPALVSGLPADVIWQRITCGWSHCAARGVTIDGSSVVYMWGRADLGAIDTRNISSSNSGSSGEGGGCDEDNHGKAPLHKCSPLPCRSGPLPNGAAIHEVWCGSEHTLACDASGALWARGWNEHGNLGVGRQDAIVNDWLPVLGGMASICEKQDTLLQTTRQQRLVLAWEGAVGAGGGHSLLLLA